MAGEIASAYVRIRPNMTGFRAQTEAGVASAVSGSSGAFAGIGKKIAATVGLALGATAGFHIVKSAVDAAAATQKATEVIRAEYGKAGKAVVEFAEKTGVALGSQNEATLQSSAHLGILFKNLGLGQGAAAKMTTNWQKLALAFNASQGGGTAGAAEVLNKLNVAASGASTRGLRALGISIQASTQQQQAFKDGLIATQTQALTPGQKALVTYQLAMAHMPQLLALAQKHSGDFANVTARLSAEWGRAKEDLGTALLPVLTKAGAGLGVWLNKMSESGKLQKDFNGIVRITTSVITSVVNAVKVGISIWHALSGAVGGTSNVIKILLGLLVLSKLTAISGAFANMGRTLTGPLRAGAAGAAGAFRGLQSAATVAANKESAAWAHAHAQVAIANRTMVNSGTSGFARLAAAAKTESVMTSTSYRQAWVKFGAETKTAVATSEASMTGFTSRVKAATTSMGTSFKTFATTAKVSTVTAFDTIKIASVTMFTTIKAGLVSLFAVAWPLLIGVAVGYILTHWSTVKKYTLALVHASAVAFKGLAEIVVGAYQYIYGKAFYYIVELAKKALDVLVSAAGWIPFIGGKIKAAAAAVDGFAGSVHKFAESGRQRILSGFTDITSGVTKAWSDSLRKSANDPANKDAAKKAGTDYGKTYGQSAAAAAASTAKQAATTLGNALQSAIQAANTKITDTVKAAKDNLVKIGADLAKTIDTINQKIGGAVGAVAGSPQGAAFEKLKKLIESGAPSFEIAKAQAELQGQLTDVGKTQQTTTKSVVATQLANLTAALNKGQISYAQFQTGLHKILREHGITLKEALKAGGKAFADTYRAEVAALKAQAKQIAEIPAKFRNVGGAGGTADIKIIRPLEVIRQEQAKVAVAAAKQRAAQLKAEQATAKNTAVIAANARTQQLLRKGVPASTAAPSRQVRDAQRRSGIVVTRPSREVADAQRKAASESYARQHRVRQTHVVTVTRPVVGSRGHDITVRRVVPGPAPAPAPAPRVRRVTPEHVRSAASSIVQGLRYVCSDILAADKDIVQAIDRSRTPMENLRRTEVRIADRAERQRSEMIRHGVTTNNILRRIDRNKGPAPGFNKERPGTGSHNARKAHRAGVKV